MSHVQLLWEGPLYTSRFPDSSKLGDKVPIPRQAGGILTAPADSSRQ